MRQREPSANSSRKPYALAAVVALGAFLAFVAVQYLQKEQISLLPSLITASLITAACASGFAFCCFDRPPWIWAILLSSIFWLFLIIVFITFRVNGEAEWWPLADAVTIFALSCLGAYAGRSLRRALNRI